MSHENEHVNRERAKASQKGGEVVNQSVQIFTDNCPECGRTYVSGGETRTTVRTTVRSDSGANSNQSFGKLVDVYA
ncbi:MAG: hypothetical protein ACM3UZ_07485 [Acidobacteriota bacterium]